MLKQKILFKEIKNKVFEKYNLNNLITIFIILFSILIRIPLNQYPFGNDEFEIYWSAQALKYNFSYYLKTVIIHPLSIFGFYPQSHYPIGIIFFLFCNK